MRDIKQELVEMEDGPGVGQAGYSTSEPECITIYDSDEEEFYHHQNTPATQENSPAAAEAIHEEEDQEVQIVMESETSLYEKVLRNLKVEYIEPPPTTGEEVTEEDQYTEMTEKLRRERMGVNKTGESLLESDREDDKLPTNLIDDVFSNQNKTQTKISQDSKKRKASSGKRNPVPKSTRNSSRTEKTDDAVEKTGEGPGKTVEKSFYIETDGGYVPKKLSLSDITLEKYQEPERKRTEVEKKTKVESIILPRPRHNCDGHKAPRQKTTLKWSDQSGDGRVPLVSVRYIPSNNHGTKVEAAKIKKNFTDNTVRVKKVPVGLTMDHIIAIILNWKMNWLEEQKKKSHPPPILQKPIHNLLPVGQSFSSWINYQRTFLPLLMHEIWALVSRDYEEKKATPGQHSFPVFIQQVYFSDVEKRQQTVRVLAVLTEDQLRANLILEGSLVQFYNKFAFVYSLQRTGAVDPHQIERLREVSVLTKGRGRGEYSAVVLVTLRLRSTPSTADLSPHHDRPVKLKCLSRLRSQLRKVSAVLELAQSPLLESLLSPRQCSPLPLVQLQRGSTLIG